MLASSPASCLAGQRSGAGPWRSRLADSPAGEVSVGFCPRFLPRSFLCFVFFSRVGEGWGQWLRVCPCVPGSSTPAVLVWEVLHPPDRRAASRPAACSHAGVVARGHLHRPVSLAVPGAAGTPWLGCPRCVRRSPGGWRLCPNPSASARGLTPDLATGLAQVLNDPVHRGCTQRTPFWPRPRGQGQTDGCIQPSFGDSALLPGRRDLGLVLVRK